MISRAQYAAPTMIATTPRTRLVGCVVGRFVTRAALASRVDRDASAAATAAARENLDRHICITATHINCYIYNLHNKLYKYLNYNIVI